MPPKKEALVRLHDEAKSVLDRQLVAINEQDGKVASIMTMGATIVSIVVAGVAIIGQNQNLSTFLSAGDVLVKAAAGLVVLGALLVVVAIGYAANSYQKVGSANGVASQTLRQVLSGAADEESYLRVASTGYLIGIEQNHALMNDAAEDFRQTTRYLVWGVRIVAAGAIALLVRLVTR